MKCAYCGKNNKPGALVCSRCGIALPPSPPEQKRGETTQDPAAGAVIEDAQILLPEESGKSEASGQADRKQPDMSKTKPAKKRTLIGVIAVLALAFIVAGVIFIIVSSSDLIMPARNGYSILNGNAAFYNGEPVVFNPTSQDTVKSSLDGAVIGCLSYNGELSCLRGGATNLVSSKVADFAVSADGSTIVYLNADAELWSYPTNGGSPVRITAERAMQGFAVSPDGGSCLYTKESDSTLCAYADGELRTVGEGMVPISISDGGRHIYSFNPTDNALYYTNRKGKSTYLRSNLDLDIYLNSKHDEIVFSTMPNNGAIITMFCNGGEPVELVNSMAAACPVMPVSAIVPEDSVSAFRIHTCPARSFDGKLFISDSLVLFRSGAVDKLENEGCSYAVASDDYKTVCYLCSGNVMRRDINSGSEPERIASDCSFFMISTNAKLCWYLNESGELHFIKGTDDSLIAVNTTDFAVPPAGKSAIFISGGKLCCNKNGNPSQCYVYEDIPAEAIFADRNSLYYYTSAGAWAKLVNGGKKADLTK